MSIGKVPGLDDFLNAMNSLEMGHISEGTGEDKSAMGDAGGGAIVATGGTTAAVSARDRAIANLPSPKVMQKQLEMHIREEVKKLRKQAHHIAKLREPGSAYHLSKLYARMRQFNTLLSGLFDAGADVIRRFFIRVFIDRQPIL
ncbi:hypothetical protein HZA87_05360 [Candidatus Uhrbacteria bacterium]|nr:hypothetical protein [Candidatus Uhrbacteria bacterium]